MADMDFFSAGYIAMSDTMFDTLSKIAGPAVAISAQHWWAWIMVLFILSGFWFVYGGMQDKISVLGGGVNKWSAEAKKWKWKITAGFLLIHANYVILLVMKGLVTVLGSR